MLLNCLNAKKNTFGIRNTQYSLVLTFHKRPSVFNTTYTIQSPVNCPFYFVLKSYFLKYLTINRNVDDFSLQ